MRSDPTPNADQSDDSLEARLRTLPPPCVPEGLEARLLAAIPTRVAARRRWPARLLLITASAAAVLLTVLGWPRPDDPNTVLKPAMNQPALLSPDDWLEFRHGLNQAEPRTFAWPLNNTLTSTIPPDLLE
jgi:hypothetical protein